MLYSFERHYSADKYDHAKVFRVHPILILFRRNQQYLWFRFDLTSIKMWNRYPRNVLARHGFVKEYISFWRETLCDPKQRREETKSIFSCSTDKLGHNSGEFYLLSPLATRRVDVLCPQEWLAEPSETKRWWDVAITIVLKLVQKRTGQCRKL